MTQQRCPWADSNAEMQAYHDHEWGIAVYDEQRLFEFLCLEGAQAGLSWQTILKRRENYRSAFYNFEIAKVVQMTEHDIERLMLDVGIIRNRLKINSVINNARQWLKLSKTLSMVETLWQFSPKDKVIYHAANEVPVSTRESIAMSKWLKSQGFSFVGPTICYALMQATGMVNDHLASCFVRHSKKNEDSHQ
ncbi:DNA-3-methyladenine glycosylase I [Caedibacter taeniospiralis]|jgi:DNA-3-methyladenine glycosylase I|uniref:DNA-3-methyladenine glycosylase I n=1 Tax=Caedibacter taeniospiralis TaxID=28907 RepID=UPI0037BEC02E